MLADCAALKIRVIRPAGRSRRIQLLPGRSHSSAAGHSLIELVMVLVIVVVLFAISIPIATNAYRGYHLTAASSQAAGAIQAARYQAVSTGCPYTITLPSSSTTYQLATEVISGSPPACAGTYSNVGESISYSTSGDVSVNSGTTTLVLTMNPNGIVTATGGAASCTGAVGCFVLTNSKSTNTIKVSGVGNVTVTSP